MQADKSHYNAAASPAPVKEQEPGQYPFDGIDQLLADQTSKRIVLNVTAIKNGSQKTLLFDLIKHL